MVEMEKEEVKRCRAIVMFGPATPTSGTKPATYYQVVIDPAMVSPSGNYIRFGTGEGDEIFGWQRVDALTVCEVLLKFTDMDAAHDTDPPLWMMVIK